VLRATYDTGLGANGSEIISVREKDGIAALTNIAGSIDVLDLSNPLQPVRLRRVLVNTATGTPNSVAVHPQHDYFLVVTGTAGVRGTVAAYRISDGSFIDSALLGVQPDSIAISPNGQYAVVANEAEGSAIGNNGGNGSLSIIDLRGFNGVKDGELAVRQVDLVALGNLPGASTGRTDDLARLPIDNTPGTIEPENVAFSKDSRYAYVTLQENNAVLKLDVTTGDYEVFGVGRAMHMADLTTTGGYQPTQPLNLLREPDGIDIDQTGRFFVTADEGDTRDASGNSGPRGGRTVSVFDALSGALLGDTGSQIDDRAADEQVYPDSRSNRGGSEPEGLDLTHYRGFTLVAVTLERAESVALVDLSNPASPTVVDVQNLSGTIPTTSTGPEAVKFFHVGHRLFLASANEVSGTVSILEVVFPD
jgi:DNA-binding beta-propeller fold protein YncE